MTPDQSSQEKSHEHGDLAQPVCTAHKVPGKPGDLKFTISLKDEFKIIEFICNGTKPQAIINKASSPAAPHSPNSKVGNLNLYSLTCTLAVPRSGKHVIEATHAYEHDHELIIPFNHKTNHDVGDPRG